MIRIKKRIAILLVFLLFLSAVQSGCKKPQDTPSDASSLTEEDAQPAGKITWIVPDYGEKPYLQQSLAAFKESYPQIEVEVVDVPSGSYLSEITIALNTPGIDIVQIPDMVAYSNWVGQGKLEELDAYWEDNGYTDFSLVQMKEELTIDKHIYMLPYICDYWVLYYNKDIFDAKETAYPTNEMTWETFQETAQAVSDESACGIAWDTSPVFFVGNARAESWTNMNQLYDRLKSYYEIALKLQQEGKSYPYTKLKDSEDKNPFLDGRAAMTMMPLSFAGSIPDSISWAIAAVPHTSGREVYSISGSVEGSALAASASREQKELASLLLQWLTSEDAKKIHAQEGQLPLLSTDETAELYAQSIKLPESDMLDTLIPEKKLVPYPPTDHIWEISKVFNNYHDSIMRGDSIDLGIALNSIKEQIKELEPHTSK